MAFPLAHSIKHPGTVFFQQLLGCAIAPELALDEGGAKPPPTYIPPKPHLAGTWSGMDRGR